MLLRHTDYALEELYGARDRYGSMNRVAIGAMAIGTALGWGLVTSNMAGWLRWQGYLLGPNGIRGRQGEWAHANLGVLVALGTGFFGQFLLCRNRVRRQESANPQA